MKLHGWNRHTMYTDKGSALTYAQLAQYMAIVKNAKVNSLCERMLFV